MEECEDHEVNTIGGGQVLEAQEKHESKTVGCEAVISILYPIRVLLIPSVPVQFVLFGHWKEQGNFNQLAFQCQWQGL